MAIPSGYKPLPGSERPQIAGSTLIGPVDGPERIQVTVLLRKRPGSPPLPDLEHWQNTPHNKRKTLSPAEFGETYGAAEDDMDAVLEYLTSKGLRMADKHAAYGRIVVEG